MTSIKYAACVFLICIIYTCHSIKFLTPSIAKRAHISMTRMTATISPPSSAVPRIQVSTPSIFSPAGLYNNMVTAGQLKGNMCSSKPMKTAILGLLAGAYISIGGLLALSVGGNCPGLLETNKGLQKFLFGAIGLPSGLFFNLVCGGELFTGNTAVMTASLLEKKSTLSQLLKNWTISYVTNLVGSIMMAWLVFKSGVLLNPGAAISVATAKVGVPFLSLFIRGMLCNWLVCLAVWMSAGASTATDKFISIWLPVTAFTAIGFEHSIANMFLIPLGMFYSAPVSLFQFFVHNLLPVTLGNIVGGSILLTGSYSAVFGNGGKN